MNLKKGDQIIVVAGKDKGQKGKIDKVFPKTGKVRIPAINVFKRHQRSQGEKKPGGIIEIVKPLPVSNVAYWCQKCNRGTRIGYKINNQNQKVRICRKCQQVI